MPFEQIQSKLDYLSKAVEQWQRRDLPVSQAPNAVELKSLIDVTLGQQGAAPEVLEQALDDFLRYNPNSSRPEFYKLLYSGMNSDALLGDWVASLCNSTMHTYQVGPVATLMELELVDQLNALIGFSEGEGVMVAGGSQANLIGMMLARHRVCPEFKTLGSQAVGGRAFRAYVSDQAHYSYERAVNLLGIGTSNLIKIASDDNGEMIVSELKAQIEKDIKQDKLPFFIGLTAGTTVIGAFDQVRAAHQVAKEYGLWMHIDGAWGAPVLFSEQHASLLADSQLADSLTWDAHKLMNVPITAAFVLVKESGMLKPCIAGGGGDYLFHTDANADYNLGEKSIQCGRRADSLKVWLSWKAKGNLGFSSKVDHLFDLKSGCINAINDHPNLEMLAPAVFLNVLFRFHSQHLGSEQESTELNRAICKQMVIRGGPHVDFAQYKGRTGIRLILGNDAAKLSDLESLFSQVNSLGLELESAMNPT